MPGIQLNGNGGGGRTYIQMRGTTGSAINIGDEPVCFLEMFRSARFADVSLSQWMALTPPELVRAHLNLDEATLRTLPKKKPIVVR